jgi:tellurium resistance protein TerZ
MCIFVAAAYSGGTLRDIAKGQLHIMEEQESREIGHFDLSRSNASVDIASVMFREPLNGAGPRNSWRWSFRAINRPPVFGQHFMDVLPSLSEVIRAFLPHAPPRQKVAFAMEKGGVLDLPQGMGAVTVGLGWDVDEGECDLDVSAVLMDADGKDLESVFFGRLESEEHGIRHTGDNLTGEGEGDDEQILVDLDHIGEVVQQVFFVVNIYTPHKTFSQVAEPFCRIIDNATGAELCRYALKDAGNENGLIIARIAREAGGRWGFHALGLPCRGRTYKDSIPQLRAACKVKTASLVLRSQKSSSSLGSFETHSHISSRPSELELPPPFQGKQQTCCVTM